MNEDRPVLPYVVAYPEGWAPRNWDNISFKHDWFLGYDEGQASVSRAHVSRPSPVSEDFLRSNKAMIF